MMFYSGVWRTPEATAKKSAAQARYMRDYRKRDYVQTYNHEYEARRNATLERRLKHEINKNDMKNRADQRRLDARTQTEA